MYDVEIVRGTTNNFAVQIFDKITGENYTSVEGERALMGVKKCKNAKEYIFVKTAEVDQTGCACFKIRPEDTEELCCDRYFYDVGLECGEDFYNLIEASAFRIKNNITRKGCANA